MTFWAYAEIILTIVGIAFAVCLTVYFVKVFKYGDEYAETRQRFGLISFVGGFLIIVIGAFVLLGGKFSEPILAITLEDGRTFEEGVDGVVDVEITNRGDYIVKRTDTDDIIFTHNDVESRTVQTIWGDIRKEQQNSFSTIVMTVSMSVFSLLAISSLPVT